MTTAPTSPIRRRWFAFRLQTLFVAMTVLCCWLGYEMNWIRQRREDREWLKSVHATVYEQPYGEGTLHGAVIWPPSTQHFSWSLWILGETPASVIDAPSIPDSDVRRIKRVFPEASVHVGENNFYSPLQEHTSE